MTPIVEFVRSVFADQTTNIVIALLVALPLLDWVTGVLRAFADHSFELAALDVFIRTQIAGRVLPLIILLVLGRIVTIGTGSALNIPGLDLSLLTGGGIAAAVPFLLVTLQSLRENLIGDVPNPVPTVTEGPPPTP